MFFIGVFKCIKSLFIVVIWQVDVKFSEKNKGARINSRAITTTLKCRLQILEIWASSSIPVTKGVAVKGQSGKRTVDADVIGSLQVQNLKAL